MGWTLDDLLALDTDTYLELVRWVTEMQQQEQHG